MKKNILLGFLFLSLGKVYCQDTIFTHAFTASSFQAFNLDNRDTTKRYFYIDTSQANNIWQSGTPLKTIFNSAYSAPLALVTDTMNTYPNNNLSSFKFIVWTDCNWSTVSFEHRINTDTLADGGIIEYSIDTGVTWHNIINSTYTLSSNFYSSSSTIASNSSKPGFTGTSGWVNSWFQGNTLNNLVEYKFTFSSDGVNTNKDGWMIDDIVINNMMVGINEIGEAPSVHVFPNPASDYIKIKIEVGTHLISASIRDIFGNEILHSDQTTIDLSKFTKGIYLLDIITDKGRLVKKVVKQ